MHFEEIHNVIIRQGIVPTRRIWIKCLYLRVNVEAALNLTLIGCLYLVAVGILDCLLAFAKSILDIFRILYGQLKGAFFW